MSLLAEPQDRALEAFEDGIRLQLQSADLIRHSIELRRRTDLACRRYEAVRLRVIELERRVQLLKASLDR